MIKGFTGIDQPYEAPEKAEIECKTMEYDVEECVQKIVKVLEENEILPSYSTKVNTIL